MANLENIAAWADALDSGEYEQGKHSLHEADTGGRHTWCCLGVACDLAVKAGIPLVVKVSSIGMYEYDSQSGGIPEKVRKWLDTDVCGDVLIGRSSAISLNDWEDKTFPEIAVLIREHFGVAG